MPSRRSLTAAVIAGLLVTVAACSSDGDDRAQAGGPSATSTVTTSAAGSPSPSPSPSPRPLAQLPRGGRSIFPRNLVVAYYGSARNRRLGILGKGSPDSAAAAVQQMADRYAAVTTRQVLPAFDFIVTVADAAPGPDRDYSGEVDPGDVQRYLTAARKAKMLLVLDFQPGKADPLTQLRRYERFLLQPDVGVALDPEWVLPADSHRFDRIGHMGAATINQVSSYLANLTLKNRLPEKLFMLHQFRTTMIPDRDHVVERPGLATVVQADGHGDRRTKLKVYATLATTPPLRMGIKLFPRHPDLPPGFKYVDTDLLSPAEVLGLTPQPEFISYQ